MRYIFSLLLFLVFQIGFALDLSGYYENQTSFTLIKNARISSYNKFRIDFSKDVEENLLFHSDAVFQSYNGTKSFCLLDYIPQKLVANYSQIVGISEEDLDQQFSFSLKNRIFLDNAFLSIYLKKINFRIGKQQIALGAGYAWNPTDVFNKKDILDPTYEKTGVNALKVEFPFSSSGSLYSLISIGNNWAETTKGIYLKDNIFDYDVELSYSQKYNEITDYYLFSNRKIKDDLLGFSFSGALFGLGIWDEIGCHRTDKNFVRNVFGMDYTFENGIYLMCEYYFNEKGKSKLSDYHFEDWMNYFSDNDNLARNYLYFGESSAPGELWNFSNYFIFNLDDQSFNYSPWLAYSMSDNLELIMKADFPLGKQNSEFNNFEKDVLLRIKFYF